VSSRDGFSIPVRSEPAARPPVASSGPVDVGGTAAFWVSKRLFDIVLALVLLPVLALGALLLLVANPFFNPGPLFFTQIRMGYRGAPFRMIKFRTMSVRAQSGEDKFASAEASRITPFANLLRKTRFDELPQVCNVLVNEMSFVGPRPEQLAFAKRFSATIPNYSDRHNVRPGITGLAQITNGYADCEESTRRKLAKDLEYIEQVGWCLEAWVVLKTLCVVFTGFGAI
jgi:lipopolysaccharide/colanic/teichoic acid biosynthesis glycosyltransferase